MRPGRTPLVGLMDDPARLVARPGTCGAGSSTRPSAGRCRSSSPGSDPTAIGPANGAPNGPGEWAVRLINGPVTIRILPPPGAPRRLAAAQLSNSVGDGAYYVCSALHFTRVVGLSPAQIGPGLTIATAQCGLAASRQALLAGLVPALPGPAWAAAALLVLGAVLQADGEMRQSAGSWQIGFSLAPADRIGQYQGFFGTGVPVARTAGPLLLTWLLLVWGIPGWLLLGAILLAASYGMGPAVRRAGAVRQQDVPAGAVVHPG